MMSHPNRFPRRRFAALAACLLLATSAHAQTKIAIGYPPANFTLPAMVAKEQGFFEKRGLDVTLTIIPIIANVPAAIVSGSVQAGVLVPSTLLAAAEGGLDLQAVVGGATQTKQVPVGGVAVRPDTPINAPADFAGKRIAVPGLNALAHITFMKWLKAAGVDPKQPRYVEAAFPQMGDMLKGGTVDAVLAVEPFLSRLVEAKSGRLLANFQAEIMGGRIETFYAMSKAFIDKNPTAVAAFRDAVREGVEWIAKNEAAARRYQVTYLKLPEPVAMSVKLPVYQTDVPTDDMRFWIELCKEFDVIKGTVTPAQVVWAAGGR